MNIELMDRLAEVTTTWFWLLMLATFRALPILILVTAVLLAFRRKLHPSLHAMLLTIVVVRLLIPVSLGSPLSLHKPIDSWLASDAESPVNSLEMRQARHYAYGILPSARAVETQSTPVEAQVQSSLSYNDAGDIIVLAALALMISASVWLLFRSVFAHLRFALKLRSCRILDDQRLIDLLLRECDSLAVGRRPVVREVPSIDAPAVFGLFRHTICFPACLTENLSEQELRWVVRHELAHIRRYDIPVAIIASIAGAFHWFNPIVWLVVSRMRAAMEAAADGLALKNVSDSDTVVYGDLLLRFAERSAARKQLPVLGLISMASGKDLKRRVELLIQARCPIGLSAKVASAVMVIAIAALGLTDARETSKNRTMPELHLVVSDSIDVPGDPMWNDPWIDQENEGPSFVDSYDVSSIFEAMPMSLSASDKSPEELLTLWLPLSPTLRDRFRVTGMTLSADLTARQHQLLKQTLEIWKEGEPSQIAIEARVIQTNLQTASLIDWVGSRVDGLNVKGLGPSIAARIDETKLAQLVRTVSSNRNGNIIFGPKVTLFNGQTGSIADQVKRPFVTGLDPKPDGRMQPIVSIVEEGLRLLLTPRAGKDGSITLEFKVQASSIGKVSYANLPIRLANKGEPEFTVQVPATEQYEVSLSAKLAEGESIAIAIPRVFDNEPGADAATTVIVALTPRIIKHESHFESESADQWLLVPNS